MNNENTQEIGVREWLITLVIMMIPVVGIVMAFVWGFGSGTKPSKANFFKAYLCLVGVLLLLWLLFVALFSSMLAFQ